MRLSGGHRPFGDAAADYRGSALRWCRALHRRGLAMTNDHEVAATLASEAGELLVAVRSRGGTEGDRLSNELLLRRLAELRPDDAVLSEESVDDPVRLERRRVWIVDPLDGTREYGGTAPRRLGRSRGARGRRPSSSTSGIRVHLSPSRVRPDYTSRDWTDHLCVTTSRNPYLPDLLVSRPEIAGRVLEALKAR